MRPRGTASAAAGHRPGLLDTIVDGVIGAMRDNHKGGGTMGTENEFITATVNGRMVRVPKGATTADLRKAAGIPPQEKISETSHRSATLLDEKAPVQGGSIYRSIVPTVQG